MILNGKSSMGGTLNGDWSGLDEKEQETAALRKRHVDIWEKKSDTHQIMHFPQYTE